MRYKAGQKEEARMRLVAAAGRGFRGKGYAGIGVDGLAKEAEVTSGAFYSHFPSKDAAFREAVAVGLEDLRQAIATCQDRHGPDWRERFVAFYLSEKRTCDLAQGCAMQTLSADVARAEDETKAIYRAGMLKVVAQVAEGLHEIRPSERDAEAWRILSVLVGAVTLARAVGDAGLGAQVAGTVRDLIAGAAPAASRGTDGGPAIDRD